MLTGPQAEELIFELMHPTVRDLVAAGPDEIISLEDTLELMNLAVEEPVAAYKTALRARGIVEMSYGQLASYSEEIGRLRAEAEADGILEFQDKESGVSEKYLKATQTLAVTYAKAQPGYKRLNEELGKIKQSMKKVGAMLEIVRALTEGIDTIIGSYKDLPPGKKPMSSRDIREIGSQFEALDRNQYGN